MEQAKKGVERMGAIAMGGQVYGTLTDQLSVGRLSDTSRYTEQDKKQEAVQKEKPEGKVTFKRPVHRR